MLLVKIGLFSSKGEAIGSIQNGGAYLNNERVEDPQFHLIGRVSHRGGIFIVGAGKKEKMILSITR